ncbi:hypothetical protein Psi01_45630 [Planobispora siamensis]|uniref:Uncharacterized protein n=1 Tax=Planobispora siamensis TaxID=936338 RepID=A0A8J3WLJ4_9ACTN|nr:hypothetical protein Psi01_45630 [Planobispora siamensis]
MWSKGRGCRQELAGTRPLTPPRETGAPVTDGTSATYELDPSYVARGAAIAAPFEGLDLHGEWCAGQSPAGSVVVRDLRRRSS